MQHGDAATQYSSSRGGADDVGNGGEGGGEPGPCADVYSTSQVNVGKQKTATMKISHTKNAKGEDLEGEEEEGGEELVDVDDDGGGG